MSIEHLEGIRELHGSLISEDEDKIYRLLDRLELLICCLQEVVRQGNF